MRSTNIQRLIVLFTIIFSFFSCNFFQENTEILPELKQENTEILPELKDESNWHYFCVYNRKNLNDITTFTANGLVSENLSKVFIDSDYIYAGSLEAGISYIKINDLRNPKGKVLNYVGRDGNDTRLRFGFSDFALRTSDNKVFAWYNHDIIDVIKQSIVFDNAPDYTHSYYGVSPKVRFVFDDNDNIWVGTSNQEEDGSLRTNGTGDANGLFKIDSNFQSRQKLLDDAIWNIFKDSTGRIWISGNNGIYMTSDLENLSKVFNSGPNYAEQIVEYNNEIYAAIKDYFHNPNYGNPTKDFKLYKWNNTSSTFEYVTDIVSNTDQMYLFLYKNKLYARCSSLYKYDDNSPSFVEVPDLGNPLGYYSIVSKNTMLVSTGNMTGIAVYNANDNYQTIQLTPANTAEALIIDNIHSLYSDSNNLMFIGPETSGFNTFSNGVFNSYDLMNEIVSVGFFEHKGIHYIQGASHLFSFENNILSNICEFRTNGEAIFYDPAGYLWTYPNWGCDYGGIAVLDLSTKEIKGTYDSGENNYWNVSEANKWQLDRQYHFTDVINIPAKNEVLIGVSDSVCSSPKPMPYTLKYSYLENSFSKVYLPDETCEGIFKFGLQGNTIYGVTRQKLYKYDNNAWSYLCDIKLGNDIRDMKIKGKYAFIISGWNSNGGGESGGIEVVDLENKESTHYTNEDIPLPSREVFAIEIQKLGEENYRLWVGTFNGLGYCDLTF